jgi:acyl-CoA thioesterase-1
MNKRRLYPVEQRFMTSIFPFLFLGLTATSTLAKSPVAPRVSSGSRVPTVLVLGDSLSAGYGLKRGDAYPELLAERAAAAGEPVHIVNAGVSGDTTAGALRRLPLLLRSHVDVLLVELGINDVFRGFQVPEIEANLQQIIDQTRRRYPDVRIVIAGMQLPQHSESDYLTAFGEMYARLARRNDAELVPFLLEGVFGNAALNLPDMIHPNANGQKVLASNVWPVLESALRKAKRS